MKKDFHQSYSRKKPLKLVGGFTMIELLIVVAIIALMASVVLVSVSTTRAKARDAKVVADMHEIANALNLYFQDHGSFPPNPYPLNSCYWDPVAVPTFYSSDCLIELVQGNYLSTRPRAVLGPPFGIAYYNYGSFQNIGAVLSTRLEKIESLTQTQCIFAIGGYCDPANEPRGYCICFPLK